MARMEMALGVWICTLPFIFWLLAPWLGFKVAGRTALFLLLVITGICWLLCSARRPHASRSLPKAR